MSTLDPLDPTRDHALVLDALADLVAGDADAVARCADHLAACETCRDARHEAAELARRMAAAGDDHVAPAGDALAAAVLARLDAAPRIEVPAPRVDPPAPRPDVAPIAGARSRRWLAVGALAAAAAGGAGIYAMTRGGREATTPIASAPTRAPIGNVKTIERGAADRTGGLEIADGAGWRPLAVDAAIPAGARVRTDERTRVALALADGSRVALDHHTVVTFAAGAWTLEAGRVVADIAATEPGVAIATALGRVEASGAKLAITVADRLMAVQVVRGRGVLATVSGDRRDVRAGEEGTIDANGLAVAAAPALAREVAWADLVETRPAPTDATTAGLGALRAYKPGETRDRDWNLALAKHDVKVRIVGPVARTEITETFRNDSDTQLEGVYQFPLPSDAQIDGLELDNKDAPGGFLAGAFVDKERGKKIWKGVIDKATPHPTQIATSEMIWVPGKWRDPALLDWQRGGRFELRIFPIPAKGARTIKIAYTQVVTPRGPYRQYVYPLPHSADGSTVADQLAVDVEVRGAEPGQVRASGYPLVAKPAASGDVAGLTMVQSGFVPRGDLVIDYRAQDGDAELRAWSYAGGAAVAPDDKLAQTKNVGIDPKVVEAQRAIAADLRPTAVIALHPKLPRWSEDRARDYVIAVDTSQSMVGERAARAKELVAALLGELDRRDRATVIACDSECRHAGPLRAPTNANASALLGVLADEPAGASDVVGAIRAAADDLRDSPAATEKWVIYVGDGFATTGFRRPADVERAIAASTLAPGVHVTTIGLGGDVDDAVLAAAARGGGGAFVAWHPGDRVRAIAAAALESTYGAALRDATLELPAGLVDAAPTVLPTIRSGDEVLVAARVTADRGDIRGDVVLKGLIGSQPYSVRIPLAFAVSSAAGNGFVPRLWATLAIAERERAGAASDRAQIVALSQGYGVMSRATSLLVLESQQMFDAFGVDRGRPAQTWTGEDALDETTASAVAAAANTGGSGSSSGAGSASGPAATATPAMAGKADTGATRVANKEPRATTKPAAAPAKKAVRLEDCCGDGEGYRNGMILVHREWVRVPSVTPYDGVAPAIAKAVTDFEAALAANPDSRERHRNLVQALAYAGELDRAQGVARRWLERDRLDGQALGYIADLLGRDGQRDQALRVLAGLVDLDPDHVALHERLARAYETVGHAAQACAERVTIATLEATADRGVRSVPTSGAAIRCLRVLGRPQDAELVAGALPDDRARAAAEKAATVTPLPRRAAGELAIAATWDGGADLDLTLVTPDGTRVSWMGGKSDVVVTDALSTEKEALALASIKRGNYLVEVGRARGAATTMMARPARGVLDIAVLGERRTVAFEIPASATHVVAARVSIGLQEVMYDEDGTPVYRNYDDPNWDHGRRIR